MMNTKQKFSTLVDLLRYRGTHQSNQTAYTFLYNGETETGSLTYGELEQQSRVIASQLQKQGLTDGDRALLLYPPGLEFISAFFGCLYAGVVAVPTNINWHNEKQSRLQSILLDAEAKVALTTTSLLLNMKERFAQMSKLAALQWIVTDNIVDNLETNFSKIPLSGKTLAYLQYTSGSTSQPKGVMVSHNNLLCNLEDLDLGWEHTSDSVIVTWLPTFHDMGLIYGIFQPLYKGFPCYMMSPMAFLQRPLRWLQAISRYKATHSGAPNFAYQLCIDKIPPELRTTLDLSCWRVALNGAELVRYDLIKRFSKAFAPCGFNITTFCPGYGLAEATLKVTAVQVGASPKSFRAQAEALEKNRVKEATQDTQMVRTLVGCGWSKIDTKIIIVHPESLTQCPAEEVGEIWVSGSTVAQGYWMRVEETEQAFQAYLSDTGEGPFLRTGDLGFVKDKELFVTGRLKDLIIIRGRNHYPQDIELTVEQSHLGLRIGCGAAFGVEVDNQEQLVVVHEVERTWLRKLDLDEVIGDIRQALMMEHELRTDVVVLIKPGSLPKTSSGKIMRHACRTKFLEGTLEVLNIGASNLENSHK
jgi:acyl-CoA synthetase (AMP-forming)/AMP-acid ligase II